MKVLLTTICFNFFCLSVCCCQYTGGAGKGNTGTSSSISLGNNIFSGGSNDGIVTVQSAINLGNNIYKGGADDGVDKIAISTDLGTNIFKGGIGDGFAKLATIIDIGTNIFAGGTGDGITKAISNTSLGNNIFTGGGGGDGWAMVAASQILLPVSLSTFTGIWQQNNALLSWQTSSEINTKQFELERSFDGNHYDLVSALPAAANSNILRNYHYIDPNIKTKKPATATVIYYRLKTVDKDGKYTYSGVVALNANNNGNYVFAVYPNPASRFVTVTVNNELLSKQSFIKLTDQQGRLLLTKKLANLTEQIEVSKYPPGLYYLLMSNNKGLTFTQKLIITK